MSEHRPTWPPPGYSMRPNGVRLACCDRCGALVGDTDRHDERCKA